MGTLVYGSSEAHDPETGPAPLNCCDALWSRSRFATDHLSASMACCLLSGLAMILYVYRCPNKGSEARAWIAHEPPTGKSPRYERLKCTVCGQVHLIDPQTGHILREPGQGGEPGGPGHG